MKSKFRVFFCDDEAQFRSKFAANHANSEFEISDTNDVEALPRLLGDEKHLPDLLVLDLYHCRASPDSPEAIAGDKLVDEKLLELNVKLEEVKEISDRFKEPRAIKILHELRANPRLKNLPVLLYTRQGLSVINDEELQEAHEYGAEWMLKGRKPETERRRMHSFIIKNTPARRLRRDIVLAVLSTAVGWILSKLF